MKPTILLTFLSLQLLSSPLRAVTAEEVFKQVADKYASLKTLSAEGRVISKIDTSAATQKGQANQDITKAYQEAMSQSQTSVHTFKLKLGQPDLYCIEWQQKVTPSYTNQGAVWATGDGDFLMMGTARYAKMNNRQMSLGAATGISGGAAATLPAIFFKEQNSMLKMLKDLTLEKDEKLAGEDCYVVNGRAVGQQFSFWIGKRDFLIRQKRHILGGTMELPKMSDEDITKTLKQLNKEVTPEAIAQMRNQLEMMKKASAGMKGSITETYENIVENPKLDAASFRYPVPAGMKPSASPF